MKNPLNKRLPRELVGEFGKYLVIFLFMTLTIGFISGFLVAGGSMIEAYNNSFEKYTIEDGHFTLDGKATKRMIGKLEDQEVQIVPQFYKDETSVPADRPGKQSTIRLFAVRKKVNKICLMKGKLPETETEIAIDRMYAQNNALKIGEQLKIDGKELMITGFVALSDYSALFSDNNDTMFDSIKFGVAVMTDEGYQSISDTHETYCYSWLYDKKPQNDVEKNDRSEEFVETLATQVAKADMELKEYVPEYANQAIHFTGDDMGGDRGMMIALLYILIIILAFVFSITINHTIVRESAVIGTLRASGYTKGEIFRHYLAMPVAITLLAALTGNILGYTKMKEVAAAMYYGSYSLPTYKTIWNSQAFILTTVYPVLIMIVVNAITLQRKLRLSPLKFIRRDLSASKKKKAMKLPHFKFFSRFRLRVIFQNMSGYVVMFIGIFFSSVLLIFGMMMVPLLKHYNQAVLDGMLAKYQYVLTTQVETEDTKAEKYCMTSLVYQGKSRSEDISVYGIESDSRYLKHKLPQKGVVISESFADKYGVKAGQTLKLSEKYENKTYSFQITDSIPYVAGIAVFMDRDLFNATFDVETGTFETALSDPQLLIDRLGSSEETTYYTGYFSNRKLTDIPDKYVSACITQDDMTKLARQLNKSMGSMFRMVNVFAVIMAAMLIYLLTKLILEKNTVSISMIKILGYSNGEIANLYLLTTSAIVALSIIASLGLASWALVAIYQVMMMDFSGWITIYLDKSMYPKMVFMIMAAYGVVALLQFHKIRKIPMDEALKNVE